MKYKTSPFAFEGDSLKDTAHCYSSSTCNAVTVLIAAGSLDHNSRDIFVINDAISENPSRMQTCTIII